MTVSSATITTAQQALLDVWQRHVYAEFARRDVEAALDTMTEDAHVYMVPILVGGVGKQAVREFYSKHFLSQIPADIEPVLISQTIGQDRIIEESIYRFTHSLVMDWVLPGVPPTGTRVEVAVVAIVQFRADKIAHEHLYWDQASVLAQLGLLDTTKLPIGGVDVARRLLDTRS